MSRGTGPDVVVVGAGVAGLSSALHLAELGVGRVVVLEAGGVGGGSSGLSVGIVETQYLNRLDIELRVRSMEFFDRLERDGFRIVRNGYLRLCRTEDELAAARASAEVQRALGVREVRVLDPEAIGKLVPHLSLDGVLGGLFGPRDGYVDGHELCATLAERARALGARVLTGLRVEGMDQRAGRLRVRADDASFECDVVVNAAGAWASRVGELLGAPVDVTPQRHQAALVRLTEPLPYVMPSVMDYTPHSGGIGLYFRDEGPGRLIAGLHTEEALYEAADPDAFPPGADPDFLAQVAEGLARSLPGLGGAALAGGWAGLYPVSPDGYPLVGPHPEDPRVVVAGGLGGSGIQLSPVVGRLVAEWIVHGEARGVEGAEALLPGRFVGERAAGADEEVRRDG